MTAGLENWFTRWWDFVDTRGVIRRVVLGITIWMLWRVTAWSMAYADAALAAGNTDASLGAVMMAVGGPATVLAGYVFKLYVDSRQP
jgi:hypothetical protein